MNFCETGETSRSSGRHRRHRNLLGDPNCQSGLLGDIVAYCGSQKTQISSGRHKNLWVLPDLPMHLETWETITFFADD
jgi:hypothetical protein